MLFLSGKTKQKTKRLFYSVFIWVMAAVWFAPIFWMLVTSFKETGVAVVESPPRWLPQPVTLENYRVIFTASGGININLAFLNSILVATISSFAGLLVAIPAAYALARLRFPGQKIIFWTYVAVLAFPPVLFLVPNYFIIFQLNLMNTFSALILPGLGGTFGVFLLRQYMLGIPREIEEVAWIDGCSKLRFLISIGVPIIKPALVTLGLMTFLASWNNFLWPLLVLTTAKKFTLPIALVRFTAGWGDPFRGIGPSMAAAFMSVGPALVIFVLFRRYLMRGISLGSVVR